STGWTLFGGNAAPTAALRTGPIHRKVPLTEGDGAPALALGTGGPGCARGATTSGAGWTGLGHRQGNRAQAAQVPEIEPLTAQVAGIHSATRRPACARSLGAARHPIEGTEAAHLVVLLPLLRIRQSTMRFGN